MIHLFLCFFGIMAGEGFDVNAQMATGDLVVGQEYHFVVNVVSEEDIDSDFGTRTHEAWQKGLRKPILQLDIPATIELSEVPDAEGPKKSAEDRINNLLEKPYGRLITAKSTKVFFKLLAQPKKGDEIGINVVSYVETENPEDAKLIRHRLQLPLTAGAKAYKAKKANSSWGTRETLGIGDKAPAFDLPTGDNNRLKIADYLGTKPIFLLTYRASW